jgi:hypothetical protein
MRVQLADVTNWELQARAKVFIYEQTRADDVLWTVYQLLG